MVDSTSLGNGNVVRGGTTCGRYATHRFSVSGCGSATERRYPHGALSCGCRRCGVFGQWVMALALPEHRFGRRLDPCYDGACAVEHLARQRLQFVLPLVRTVVRGPERLELLLALEAADPDVEI